jgi:phosphoribosylaminoimidazole-succinocarboxamide synthase
VISKQTLLALIPQAFNGTDLPLPGKGSGKVRDWYDLPHSQRLIITTDRLSAFDRVVANVPYKGQVLNQLTNWWFDQTCDIIPNHKVAAPDPNAVVATVAEPFLVEVIVRGFITGVTTTALWYRYSLGERNIYGYTFPDGLQKNQELARPIITPTTKGLAGTHDERLTCSEVIEKGLMDKIGWEQVQEAALAVFRRGQELACKAGLILVDTKYEFGRTPEGNVVLIDEVNTPDSSRFWKADSYPERFRLEQEPENFDKEFVRISYAEKGYRGDGEIPVMSADLWVAASQRYMAVYEMLTGRPFDAGEYPVEPRLKDHLRVANIVEN